MFEYIKATYKVGDKILVQCSMGIIKREIIFLGEDAIGIMGDNGKRRIMKGTDISYCEDCEVIADHEYVDLGLPSGTLWATCNVGANLPTEYGDYFAWGETRPKNDYNCDTYKWCNGSCVTQTKYCVDSKYGIVDSLTILLAEDDAATANWGAGWRMPTTTEQQELIDGCDWEWTEDFNCSGVAGRIGISKTNSNTIFLPAAGYRGGANLYAAGYECGYWSASLSEPNSSRACGLYFSSGGYWDYADRYDGKSVRAVVK